MTISYVLFPISYFLISYLDVFLSFLWAKEGKVSGVADYCPVGVGSMHNTIISILHFEKQKA